MIPLPILAVAILTGLVAASAAHAEPVCYDAKVLARPVEQVPSEIPMCRGDCVVVSWPWFVDLRVKRVLDGALPSKTVRVLAVQSNYRVARDSIWLLRRNTANGYNALSSEEETTVVRCAAEAAPLEPYLRPSAG